MASAASTAGKGLLLLVAACGRVGFEPAVRDADSTGSDSFSADDSLVGSRVAPTMRQSGIVAMRNVASASTMVTVVAGQVGWAFAAVFVGATCGDPSTPTVSSITYNGVAMTKVGAVAGTPCSPTLTRTELYRYDTLAVGTGTFNVTLSSASRTLHLVGFVVESVESLGAPVPRSDNTISGTVDVPTQPDELALVIVGTGDPMVAGGPDQKVLQNAGGGFTLDNSAVHALTATGTTTAITFAQGLADEWQAVGVAVRGPVAP